MVEAYRFSSFCLDVQAPRWARCLRGASWTSCSLCEPRFGNDARGAGTAGDTHLAHPLPCALKPQPLVRSTVDADQVPVLGTSEEVEGLVIDPVNVLHAGRADDLEVDPPLLPGWVVGDLNQVAGTVNLHVAPGKGRGVATHLPGSQTRVLGLVNALDLEMDVTSACQGEAEVAQAMRSRRMLIEEVQDEVPLGRSLAGFQRNGQNVSQLTHPSMVRTSRVRGNTLRRSTT